MAMVLANDEADYAIKPEATTPALDTKDWPLLLKNYDKRMSFNGLKSVF
jgi:H/ACA ribonucleoprotein complex subunit 4